MCVRSQGTKLRHDFGVRILERAFIDAGCETDTEVQDPSMFLNYDPSDKRIPADLLVYSWFPDGRHLVIDMIVQNPLATSYADRILKPDFKAGDVATQVAEPLKHNKYSDLDTSRYGLMWEASGSQHAKFAP